MSSVNKASILGRVGKDPEVRNINGAAKVATFSVATTESYKDKSTGEKKEETTWHNIVLWRGLAEIAEKYVHKGDQIYIDGKIKTRSWEKDGVTRYTTEILGDNLVLIGGNRGTRGAAPSGESTGSGGSDASDDLPF
jgi:single-strand DNA-binding protein